MYEKWENFFEGNKEEIARYLGLCARISATVGAAEQAGVRARCAAHFAILHMKGQE